MRPRVPRRTSLLIAVAIALAVASCSSPPFTLIAEGPWSYWADVEPPLQRVAILVTIESHTGDDLAVNPADFHVRDVDHRLYPANPQATAADGHSFRLANAVHGGATSNLPLPTVTLRQGDVLSGFVVFDVPAGVLPVELIWRQTDSDTMVPLASTSS